MGGIQNEKKNTELFAVDGTNSKLYDPYWFAAIIQTYCCINVTVMSACAVGVPPSVIGAIMSRETRAGGAIKSDGRGNDPTGYGLMQVTRIR